MGRSGKSIAGWRGWLLPWRRLAPTETIGQKIKRLIIFGLAGCLMLGVLGMAGLFVLYKTVDIPNPNDEFLTETTRVFYAGGKDQVGEFRIQKRDSISYEEMPDNIKDAVVAAENRTFWTDNGLDPKGILRAAFSNASGNSTQGASTITQQYVKILYLTQERTFKRKIKEAILSLKIKNQLSKQDILGGYLNTIYFGRSAYGIQAAAQAYFAVDAKDLNLRQAAVLASVLNNPYSLDPANGESAKARLFERYKYVLRSMQEMGTADASAVAKALKALPKFPKIEVEAQYGGQRGHVLAMVKKELLRLGFSEEEINGGGLQVTTTFTKKAMDAARAGVFEEKPDMGKDNKNLHIGVASVEPGTGAVRGIYGGHNFLDSQINWATAGISAGSTFKPFALAAALEQGFELKDTFAGNSPYVLPDGTDVENENDHDAGYRIDLIKALEESVNTAFVDLTLSMDNGPQSIIDTAVKMGIPPADPKGDGFGFPNNTPGLTPFTSVALGPQSVSAINMANGYATIANRGVEADAYIIEKVVDRDGTVRYDHKVTDHEAIREEVSDDVGYAMQKVVTSGTGTKTLALDRPHGGKTGTATNGKGEVSSAWFVGYTPQLSTAVVYSRGKGNEELKGWLPEYFGGSYPARTWTAVMEKALEGEPVEDLPDAAWVTGDAPSSGHAPLPPPPPKKPNKPKNTKTVKPDKPKNTKPPKVDPTTVAPTTTAPVDPTTPPGGGCGDILQSPCPTDSTTPANGGKPNKPRQTPADRPRRARRSGRRTTAAA